MCAPESKAEAGEVVRYLGWSRRSDWKLGSLCIILQSSMRSGFICRFCPSTKRLVCGLALLALLLPSLSYAQVIEEGGFPVKAGSVWGESFSLSCPPRLVAQAGESVAISCSATAVPEEGVRYEWEPLSGDGLRLLSDAQVLAPLFTAPVSGEGAEYAYRLTAMSVGVYETATVTVIVEGVSGGSVQDRGKSPGLPDRCDSFGVLEGFREGCAAGDKMPPSFEPFEGGFEGEEGPGLLFPEAPGLPDRGGGPGRQAPPRLECPVAVFLEELETGAIECYASDAAGEEYLEYSWEPVGSTTRDYLDNPRLLPEDAPNPSVVAPEAPAYETLESFRSGDRAFRYRYRLTVTSHATGLSSSSEVEVYVSSSRPSVYCPLEIVVEEGETVALDCEGVDPLSARMDYDEEGASILWEWEGLWGTSTAPLAATHLSSPLFTAPVGSAGKQYHYIASMTSSASGVPRMARRRVSVVVMDGEEAVDDTVVGVASTAPNSRTEAVVDRDVRCSGTGGVETDAIWAQGFLLEIDFYVDEGDPDFTIQCEISGSVLSLGPITWSWTGNADAIALLEATNTSNPVFHVPDDVDQDTKYEYIVTAERGTSGSEIVIDFDPVSVTVRDKSLPLPSLVVNCDGDTHSVDEGSGNLFFECTASGVPDSSTAVWSWSPTTLLTGYDRDAPIFAVPKDVERDTTYTYTATVTAENAEAGSGTVKITVRDKSLPLPSLTCTDSEVYEGAADFALDCSVTNEPSGATYAWATRGSTSDTDDLSSTTILKPTFSVPDDIDEPSGADKDYEYTVTMMSGGSEVASADVTVTVKEKPDIVCVAAHITVSEFRVPEGYGHLEIASCSEGWTGAPSGSVYAYVWTARGDTPDTALLVSGTNGPSPTFSVPSSVNGAEAYEYRLTVSAENADPAVVDYKITVHDRIAVICVSPDPIYEGSGPLTLSCTEENKPPGATYTWTGTDVDNRLTDTDGLTPTFTPPPNVDADTDYDYTVTMMSGGSEVASANVTVTVLNTPPSIACTATPDRVYEGSADDITVSCSAQNTPSVPFIYAWDGSDDFVNLLKGWNGDWPIFGAPDNVNGDTEYVFTVDVYIGHNGCDPNLPSCALDSVADTDVTITVLEKPDIAVTCEDSPYEVDEGDSLALNCTASGAPDVNSKYMWSWSPVDRLTDHDTGAPVFSAPADVDQDTTWTYRVTATADNADDGTAEVTVTVRDTDSTAPVIACTDSDVYEATADFTLDCLVTDEPSGATYAWTGTDIANRLSSSTILKPTFDVPDNVEAHTDYDYTVTLSASGINDVTEDVTVRVLNKPSLALVCTPVAPVYEGAADFDLDCSASGAPAGSDYNYVWTPRGSTVVPGQLSSTTVAKPTFDVPDNVDADTDYEYTLTVSADNAEAATADVTVTVLNKRPLSVACASPPLAYEGSADFALACTVSGAPVGSVYAYAWTPRGSTTDTSLLTDTNSPAPTFSVPSNVDADETYEYRLTVSAQNADDATADVTVTVLNKKALSVVCVDLFPEAYEGSASFALDCSASGAPVGSVYAYAWTPRGSTTDTSLLTDTNGPAPTFSVPSNIDADETYEYRLTVSAQNADDATADVTVTVLDKRALSVVCADPGSVYEGSAPFDLNCSASGAPVGSVYSYVWSARGDAPDLSLLSNTSSPAPAFSVPLSVNSHETYEYRLTVSADNAEDATVDVTVTVLDKGALAVACASPPLVYEGSAPFDLNCSASGAPGVNPVYSYVWSARGDTPDLSLLTGTSGPAPTFSVPLSVNGNETYEYTLTVSADNAEDATADVTVTVLDKGALAVACAPPPLVYEGSAPFDLNCSASGAPGANPVYSYVWSARGDTPDLSLLTGTSSPAPTFSVPLSVNGNETYEYTLTVSAANAEDATADVTVTVLDKGALSVACAPPPLVYEGSAPFDLDCSVSGAPGANPVYSYVWSARGDTPDLSLLTGTSSPMPTFSVPLSVNGNETYEYTLTVSAANAEDATADVTVTVLDKGALSVACASPPLAYEGSAPFDLDCSASGAPGANPVYAYVWTARGTTANTDLLISGTDGPTPTFAVPDEVDATTTYEYLLTASAENAEDGSAEVTVTVLKQGALHAVCADPPPVYEGSEDFSLDCSASGTPAGSDYEYAWTARGTTPDTALLIAGTDGPTPTFAVPDEVDATTTYEYLLTASAENAEDGSAEVTVTVLNKDALAVACADPPLVYEGSEDFAFDCTASGAQSGSDYTYVWTARGTTANTALLIAGTDGPTPTFAVPDEVDATTTYEYLLTASAENAEDGSAEVTVTVLNKDALAVACADSPLVYEGSEDFAFDCTASGAQSGSDYTYVWTARGTTANTDLLISGTDGPTPTFDVPDALDRATTYEYLLTASAENAEDASAEVTVTVLNKDALAVACADPPLVYEGSEDFALDCSASGAPEGSGYAYVWTARGDTQDTSLLSAVDVASPTFHVPEEVDETTTYEYLLTVSAENAENATAEVTVTVLNKPDILLACADPGSVYEGSEDITFDCEASGAPEGSGYAYVWTARGDTQDTALLSAADVASPTFLVPDDLPETTTYEYLLTASAANAKDASAGVSVTVMHPAPLAFVDDSISGRVYVFTVGETIADILLPGATGGLPPYTYTLEPVLPRGLRLKVDGDPTRTISGTPLEVSPRSEYIWQAADANTETVQIAFFIEVAPAEEPTSPPVAESSSELPEPSALGVTVSASSLRFGLQSTDTEVSLDPMTDGISTYVSGPYHAGRMTLSSGGGEALDENGEMDLSIELASPVVLKRADAIDAASIVLSPQWSLAESCKQLSSQTIGGLYTEVTLSEDACRLLRFGGELDLTDVPSGRYAGSMDIFLRSGESEETHSVDVEVRVVPAQQVITIGPRGVRFSTSREIPAGLTEEQNLSIYPDVAFLTEEKPHGVFELSNPSLIPLEVSVSARFGYTEATENGREVVVEDTLDSRLGDLSEVVDIHPGVLVLMPGEKGLIRYGVKEGALAAMAEKGYAAFFDVVSEPRLYVRSDQMPEEISGDRTARVTMRVPGVYVPAEGTSQLRATLLSISFVGSMSATFLLETTDHPFVGEVVAYDGDGRELGRRETLVYTRSRVRIPLDRMPEEGAVFLRFSPRGSGRAPLPTSVDWDAPRRDIGDAENEGRTSLPATLVQKP